MRAEALKGHLDGLILATLANGPAPKSTRSRPGLAAEMRGEDPQPPQVS